MVFHQSRNCLGGLFMVIIYEEWRVSEVVDRQAQVHMEKAEECYNRDSHRLQKFAQDQRLCTKSTTLWNIHTVVEIGPHRQFY
jgi:hypothetical protein